MPAVGQRGSRRVPIAQQRGENVRSAAMPPQGDFAVGQGAVLLHQPLMELIRELPQIDGAAATPQIEIDAVPH